MIRSERGFQGFSLNPPGNGPIVFLVGQVMINFGSIEFLSYLWLREVCLDEREFNKAARKRFAKRVTTILSLVTRLPSDLRTPATDCWERAKQLAKARNAIAHNPIVLMWEDPEAEGEPDGIMMPVIGWATKEEMGANIPYLDIAKLGKANDAAFELAKALTDLLSGVRGGNGGTTS